MDAVDDRRRRRRTRGWVAGVAALVVGGAAVAALATGDDGPEPVAAPSSKPSTPGRPTEPPVDLGPETLRLRVGWRPEGTIGVATYTGRDNQSVRFLRTENANGADGDPELGYGAASVWLAESTADLTFTGPDQPTEAGPDVHGARSVWTAVRNGGVLTWTPSPGLRATVIAGSKTTAVRIADSVRTDVSGPVVLPFTLPRPPGLEVDGTDATRYDNGHYSGSIGFRRAGVTAPVTSTVSFWLSRDADPAHNPAPTTTLHGRPVRLSDGPPENGVNVWLQRGDGVVAGSRDAAQNGHYLRDRAGIITMVESIEAVADPANVRNWTSEYLT